MDALGIAISCVGYALAAPRGWPQPGYVPTFVRGGERAAAGDHRSNRAARLGIPSSGGETRATRPLARQRRGMLGVEGGRSIPLPAAMFNIAWAGLTTLAWLKPARWPPAKRFTCAARDGGGRAVAGKLLGLVIVGLTDSEGDGASRRPLRRRRSLPRGPVSTLPVPLGDPRSSILGDPYGP